MKEFQILKGWSNYLICEDGNLYRDTRNGLIKTKTYATKFGYHILNLSSDTTKKRFTAYLQSLMMSHFGVTKPGKDYFITHIDGDKSNNAIDNLKWTHKSKIKTKKGLITEVYNTETGVSMIFPTLSGAAVYLKSSTAILNKVINNEREIKMRTKLPYKIRLL